MSFYHLGIELIFDLLAILLGIIILIHPADNFPKLYWGIIAISIGLVFTWENTGWIFIRNYDPSFEYSDLLNIEKMLKWYFPASLVSLFPLASLRPGYLNRFRLLMFLLPTIVVTTVGICFLGFNGNITPISSVSQIGPNIHQPDIQVRLGIFMCTIVTPVLYFICPIINNKTYRRINHRMYLFIGFMFLLLGIYISFTLFINYVLFNAFGLVSIVFSIFFSFQYLYRENPLSDYKDSKEGEEKEKLPVSCTLPLYYEIDDYLRKNQAYKDSNYTIKSLTKQCGEKESVISAAIKSGGHSGFREYINHLRLEHFRYEASLHPRKSIKELMYRCGFTSRSTFYRIFSEQYNITPSQYIQNQVKNEFSTK